LILHNIYHYYLYIGYIYVYQQIHELDVQHQYTYMYHDPLWAVRNNHCN